MPTPRTKSINATQSGSQSSRETERIAGAMLPARARGTRITSFAQRRRCALHLRSIGRARPCGP
eukprot:11215110-Lingulodinium_polyedra.AAC.1